MRIRRKTIDDFFCEPIGEFFTACLGTEVLQRKDGNRRAIGATWRQGGPRQSCMCRHSLVARAQRSSRQQQTTDHECGRDRDRVFERNDRSARLVRHKRGGELVDAFVAAVQHPRRSHAR